jgi:competence protein ComGF
MAEAQDYLKSKLASQRLVHKIKSYYADRGNFNVRVWIEEETVGRQKIYQVRSNLRFTVPEIN